MNVDLLFVLPSVCLPPRTGMRAFSWATMLRELKAVVQPGKYKENLGSHLQVVGTNRKVSGGKIGGVNETVLLTWGKHRTKV